MPVRIVTVMPEAVSARVEGYGRVETTRSWSGVAEVEGRLTIYDDALQVGAMVQTGDLPGVVAQLWPWRIHNVNPCGQTGLMSKPSPARYRTTNWSSYSVALRKRGSLLIWLDKDMTWLAPPDGSPGRPAVFSDAAVSSVGPSRSCSGCRSGKRPGWWPACGSWQT